MQTGSALRLNGLRAVLASVALFCWWDLLIGSKTSRHPKSSGSGLLEVFLSYISTKHSNALSFHSVHIWKKTWYVIIDMSLHSWSLTAMPLYSDRSYSLLASLRKRWFSSQYPSTYYHFSSSLLYAVLFLHCCIKLVAYERSLWSLSDCLWYLPFISFVPVIGFWCEDSR